MAADKKELTVLEKAMLESMDAPAELLEGLASGEKTIEDFKTFKDEIFIARKMAPTDPEIMKHANGRIFGEINTKAKSWFEMTSEEMKGKKTKDIIEEGVQKKDAKIKELQEQLANDNPDEKFTKLQGDFKAVTEKNVLLTDKSMEQAKELEEEKNGRASDLKGFGLTTKINDVKRGIEFKSDLTAIERSGFDGIMKDKYKFDLDDDQNLIVKGLDGEGVKNDKGTEYLSAKDVFIKEATENKLLKMNEGGGKTQASTNNNNNNNNNNQSQNNGEEIKQTKVAEEYRALQKEVE